MRGLTLWQPMASAVARAAVDPTWKLVENRGWAPPASVLGERIAIHAAKRETPTTSFQLPPGFSSRHLRPFKDLPRGCIIATARVAGALDCRNGGRVHVPELHPAAVADLCVALEEIPLSPWWLGPVGWLLEDVRLVDPVVPQRGAMGLWRVPSRVEQLVLERERRIAA